MLKRTAIASLFFLAYTIVLVHGIIPHHHHDKDLAMEQTTPHQHDHDEDCDGDDDTLAHCLSNFIHSSSNEDAQQQPNNTVSFNTLAGAYIAALFNVRIQTVEDPPPLYTPYVLNPLLSDHCLSSKGLRAPPVC